MRKLRRRIGRIIGVLAAIVAVAAVREQLRLPPEERTWHGKVYGVPYDFRKPSFQRLSQSLWNPNDDSLFTARALGVGWSINLHRVLQLVSAGVARLRR
jgi:hypothetical protein